MKAPLLTGILAAGLASTHADEFSNWEWLIPKPAGNYLTALAFDGTRFIGVGDLGIILTSTNGTNWHLAYTETTNRMHGITIGGGRALAYGERATVLVSTNAESWVHVETGSSTATAISALAYGNDRYVLLDYTRRVFVAAGGAENWLEAPTLSEESANDLEFGGGLFTAVGWRGWIGTSTNGVDWVERESGTEGPIWSVAYGDGVWVAVGGEGATGFILTSFDAITWFLQVTDKPMYDVTFGPFGFVATGGGFMEPGTSLTSEDGLYFSGGEPGGSGLDELPTGVACGNGVCVAVGGNGGRIWTTDNGTNWVSQTAGHDFKVSSLATDGATLVGVGGRGTIVSSTDGVNFESHVISTNENYFRVIHTSDQFVALGSQGVVRTSVNGGNWQLENTGSTATLKDVAHGNDKTVVIGWNATGKAYGQFLVRDTGGLWQTVWPAANDFINVRIAFGNGRFVAAAYYGEIWTSTDGLAWQKIHVGTSRTILPIQFINGRFVGLTSDAIAVSYDGLNWYFTPGSPPATQQIAYGNGLYVAAGWNWGGIEVSEDLIHWSVRPMKTLSLTSAVYFKNAFYVSGYILKSASSLVPEIKQFGRSGGNLNFQLYGQIGRDYELQSSTNLVDWAPEQDYMQSARHHSLMLPTGPDRHFYRAKLKEP